jgi:hypothetical protein
LKHSQGLLQESLMLCTTGLQKVINRHLILLLTFTY